MLTSYDALTAAVFEQAGVRALLVGDTSSEVVLGHPDTLPVTMDQMVTMVAAVARGTSRALVVADLPFGSYQAGPQLALANAVRHLKEGGAQAVKLEGGHRVLPQVRALVGAGIGCHALVLMMEPEAVGDVVGLTQMGGEGAQWIGMAPFLRTRRHLLQNIGDGTFHHSGSLAVRAAIASGVNVTYKLLYNSAVAMTGGQQATGAMAIPALTKMLAAEGVRRIVITTAEPKDYRRADLAPIAQVWHRDRVVEAQEVLSQVEGVTVLIHDQECATELRRKRKRGLAADPAERIMINQRVCEGCGDCGEKSNCLSVQPVDTEFGRKTVIDQSSCNKDYSCLKGDCPSFLTVVPGNPGTHGSSPRPRRATAPALAPDAIADPRFRLDVATSPHTTHTTRITGVGGTGVVTLSQILSAAGRIAGRQVRSLDQTGLAQKGGAVISDVKISAGEIEQSNKAVAGECDLYLGCDLLVAADLAGPAPGRSRPWLLPEWRTMSAIPV